MQTVQIPALSANDGTNRIICPEGCAVWAGKAARPWWIHSGGIGTCVACILYEFNSAAPQVYFYHFLATGGPLMNDFTANLPARLGGNLGLFRARIYSNPQSRSANSITRIGQIRAAIAGVASITEVDTNGGFNLRLSNGTFTDGVAGAGGIGRLFNNGFPMTQFFRMQEFGGVDVAKNLPVGW